MGIGKHHHNQKSDYCSYEDAIPSRGIHIEVQDVRVRAPEVLRHAFGMLLSLDNITMHLGCGPYMCYSWMTLPCALAADLIHVIPG